jgi:hypothetical protein
MCSSLDYELASEDGLNRAMANAERLNGLNILNMQARGPDR